MKPFEQYLRLLLEYHVDMRSGKPDDLVGDDIRDEMDAAFRKLNQEEIDLLAKVSENLYDDE